MLRIAMLSLLGFFSVAAAVLSRARGAPTEMRFVLLGFALAGTVLFFYFLQQKLRERSDSPGVLRMGRLWLKAKERELETRAGVDQKP
jgi:hypothetical protein